MLKNAIRRVQRELLKFTHAEELERYRNVGGVYFSQEGEDVVLERLLGAQAAATGNYIDVGCNHPWRFSNTAALYKRGWSGIAVDPNPCYGNEFARERPRDVFVNSAVGASSGSIKYFCFEEPLFNTCIEAVAQDVVRSGYQSEPSVTLVPVRTLSDIVAEVWSEGRVVDVLSIDAEGMDEAILESHDFENFPVRWVIAEVPEGGLGVVESSGVGIKLRNLGYEPVSKLWRSAIFRKH